jgi:hypothetical protein
MLGNMYCDFFRLALLTNSERFLWFINLKILFSNFMRGGLLQSVSLIALSKRNHLTV